MKGKRKSARFDLIRVDVEHFLEVFKVESLTRATEEEWQFSCPFPGHAHGDQSPSAYMNDESTAWFCHSCKRKGNALTFLAEIENITMQESRALLQGQYGGKSPDPDQYSVRAELERFWDKRKKEGSVAPPNEILDEDLLIDYSLEWIRAEGADEIPEEMAYMFERGFSGVTLEAWEIGYDEMRERITIPTRNATGQLVGFKGRAWRPDHKPKYLVMGGERYDYPRFEKSQVVFGLDRVIARYRDHADFILCEGELDVISMHSKGFDTAICVAGSSISDMQARLIRRWGASTTIFFDSDEGGESGTWEVIEDLSPFTSLRVVPDHEGDPADMPADEIQKLLDESESATKAVLLASKE